MRSPLIGPLVGIVVFGLVAAACGPLGSNPASPVPTPETESLVILPPVDETAQAGPEVVEVSPIPADALGVEPDATVQEEPVAEPIERAPSLACLSPRTRLAQLLLPLVEPSDMDWALEFATVGELGGIGLLGFPDATLAGRLEKLQLSSFVPVIVASDEEGGSVQRLRDLLGAMPSAAASAQNSTTDEVRAMWTDYGRRLDEVGIDVVFGPVIDVGDGPGIGSRSFGADAAVVSAYGAAMADGLRDGGIMPVFKHFPGHGRASGDSHLGLPVVPALAELWTSDLLPFVDLVGDHIRDGEAAVMIGHLSVPGLTGDLPTSLSPDTINGLLRNEIGFGGLVFSDAMNMGAITDNFGALNAVERALLAGTDIVILGSLNDLEPTLDYLVERVEADPGLAGLLQERVDRVMAAKGAETICQGAS